MTATILTFMIDLKRNRLLFTGYFDSEGYLTSEDYLAMKKCNHDLRN